MPVDITRIRASVTEYAKAYREARAQHEAMLERLYEQSRKEQTYDFSQRSEPARYALIAVDGSHTITDRHRPILYAYIQAASVGWVRGASVHKTPFNLRKSCLLTEHDLLDADTGELRPPAWISNQRSMLEIALLVEAAECAHKEGHQPVLVADGSLVPYDLLTGRVRNEDGREQANQLNAALTKMREECNAWVCGYIDRPGAATLVRKYAKLLQMERADGICDRDLMEKMLKPAHRTALIDPDWEINKSLSAPNRMLVCYANFGADERHPIIARIEVPAWCADKIDDLCAILRTQVKTGRGYPFVLQAAHSEVVVRQADQKAIERLLFQELIAQGVIPGASFKQVAKGLD
jgi:hypothetical protein